MVRANELLIGGLGTFTGFKHFLFCVLRKIVQVLNWYISNGFKPVCDWVMKWFTLHMVKTDSTFLKWVDLSDERTQSDVVPVFVLVTPFQPVKSRICSSAWKTAIDMWYCWCSGDSIDIFQSYMRCWIRSVVYFSWTFNPSTNTQGQSEDGWYVLRFFKHIQVEQS